MPDDDAAAGNRGCRFLGILGTPVDPDLVLTPEHLAARAGVNLRTIFRHFGAMAGLAAAMRARVAAQAVPLLSTDGFEGPTAVRVRELVRRRSALYELVGPL